jgi:pyrophosphate--fructose-6-phosphate 1-phosphotransferase
MTTMDESLKGKHVNVAMMTSGGLAPCLSSSVSLLALFWIQALRDGKISGLTLRMYKDGYKGILISDSFCVPESDWEGMKNLNFIGGSPIGNSRVKVCSLRMTTRRRRIIICFVKSLLNLLILTYSIYS